MKSFLREVKRVIRRLPKITPGEISRDLLVEILGPYPQLILEIGCNDGTHTNWFLELFPDAEIHCFEPDQRAIDRFRKTVSSDHVTLHPIAISDRDGEVEFHVSGGGPDDRDMSQFPEGWDYSGSIRPPKKHLECFPWCSFDKTTTVATRSLDSWRREQGLSDRTIDFIWADTQGAEVDLIRGGLETLGRTRYFYTEYSNREMYQGQINFRKLMQMLPNYRLVHRYAGDLLVKNKSVSQSLLGARAA